MLGKLKMTSLDKTVSVTGLLPLAVIVILYMVISAMQRDVDAGCKYIKIIYSHCTKHMTNIKNILSYTYVGDCPWCLLKSLLEHNFCLNNHLQTLEKSLGSKLIVL